MCGYIVCGSNRSSIGPSTFFGFRFACRLLIQAHRHTGMCGFWNQSGKANESSAVCLCVCAPVNNVQSGLLKIYLYMMFMMTATQSMSAHSHTRERARERVRKRERPLSKNGLKCRLTPSTPLPRQTPRFCSFIHLLWVIEHTLNRVLLYVCVLSAATARFLSLSLSASLFHSVYLLLPHSYEQAFSPRLSLWQFHSMIRSVLSLILSVLSHSQSLEEIKLKKPNK